MDLLLPLRPKNEISPITPTHIFQHMRFLPFYLLFALLLTACGGTQPEADTQPAASTELPPEEAQLPALPKEEIPEQNFDFGKFPKEWTAMVKKGNDLQIETPCGDKDSRAFTITNDQGHYELFENMGDDGVDYTILKFEQPAPNEVKLRVRVQHSKTEFDVLCKRNPEQGTAVWKWQHAFSAKKQMELTFVDKEHLKNFKKATCQ
jgi:hypothetical protein